MAKEFISPDYIFESSWEVCNKVGGIYTVLSTRAKTLQDKFQDNIFFIGPDLWLQTKNELFVEDKRLHKKWITHALKNDNIKIRVGRWNIPGTPIAVLVDFQDFYEQKNEIYAKMWEDFEVNSLHAYGDYDEASMFSYAAGKVVESFYNFYIKKNEMVVYQAHEWMTGLGALYVKKNVPQVATIFTTHATSIGRSIAGNDKPLYNYLKEYNGNQMAWELNIEAKHSVERQTALNVDCFTTVSEITNKECTELLDKTADVVTVNGFEDDFVPKGASFTSKRKKARKILLDVANNLLGTDISDDALIIATSGRYEFKNKGIDVFIETMSRLNREDTGKEIVAFIEVPAWVKEYRADLKERMNDGKKRDTPLHNPFTTHWLNNTDEDRTLQMIKHVGLQNKAEDKVKVIFVPCYLNGNDGIFNISYYDLLIGLDVSIYPSYYEPWGYTPLESIAFKVPTVTTNLSGFGLWVENSSKHKGISDGVEVVKRDDYNYDEVCNSIKNCIKELSYKTEKEMQEIRKKASSLSKKALWSKFIDNYYDAYDLAIRKMRDRLK